MFTVVSHGRLITRDAVLADHGFCAKDGRITQIFCGEAPDVPAGSTVVDARGLYLSPGLIDAHVHGGGGADVMDGTLESLHTIAHLHLRHGMTSFVPTTLTQSPESIRHAVDVVRQAMRTQMGGARILGIHLEGPFISMRYKGAQNPDYLLAPTMENYLRIGGGEGVLRVSMAPELPGAPELARSLSDNGILVSVAHSNAGYIDMRRAAQSGFSHVTHMYNGMSGIESPDYYCRAGVIESALELDAFALEVICDGRHIPPELIRLLLKCKSKEQLMFASDSTSPAGMPEGEYALGGLPVVVTDGVAMLKDRSSFAGSVATADRLLRNAVHSVGIPMADAVSMLSHNVAKSVGMHHDIGSIEVGKRADFLLFDEDINIKLVAQDGQIVHDMRESAT